MAASTNNQASEEVISVTTSVATVVAPSNTQQAVIIQNQSATISIQYSLADVTANTNYMLLAPGASFVFPGMTGPLYARTPSSTAAMYVGLIAR